jgi:hypothetical protein
VNAYLYCTMLSQTLRIIAVCIPDYLSMTPYRCRPHERRGSSEQTSLVAATSQSVRFACSLATRCDAGQPHLHTCVCPLKRVGGKRACTLVAGTQDVALDCAATGNDPVPVRATLLLSHLLPDLKRGPFPLNVLPYLIFVFRIYNCNFICI